MPLTGHVDYGQDILVGNPSGNWAIKGLNGKRYIQNSPGALCLGNADDNTLGPTKSSADISADILAGLGIAGYASEGVLPVPGTPYIGMIRGNFDGDVYGVFYKVNAAGAFDVEGYFHYVSGVSPLGGFGDYGHVAATAVIDGELYFLINARSTQGGDFPWLTCVVHIPYTGTNIDLSAGSWDARSTQSGFTWGPLGGGRRYWNWASIRDLGAGSVGLVKYRGIVEGGPQVYYGTVDTIAQTHSAITDVSASFPEVIADAGTAFAGGPGDPFDDFTAPYIVGTRLFFLRVYYDQIATIGMFEYSITGAFAIAFVRQTDVPGFTIVAINGSLESARAYLDGADLLLALTDRRRVYFNELSLRRFVHNRLVG